MDRDIKILIDKIKELNRNIVCSSNNSSTPVDACCPATNTLLEDIKTAIQQLDISVDNLVLNTDTLEINTDGLEALLTTLNGLTQTESDETQVLLTDIKTNLQSIIDKLNQPCGVDAINVNVCGSSGEQAIDTFQVIDCEGNNVGTPQEVKKTIVLNSITTKICNVQEIADAINAIAPATYNNVSHYLLDSTNPILTIPANTVHSISYKIINATVDISIDGINLPYVLGESDMEEATTLIANEYIFDATNGKVKVKTIN